MSENMNPGIGEDVRLTITMEGGAVLDLPLIMLSMMARTNNGVVIPYVYRDPEDPETPYQERPLHYACVLILEAGQETASDWIKAGGVAYEALRRMPITSAQGVATREDLGRKP